MLQIAQLTGLLVLTINLLFQPIKDQKTEADEYLGWGMEQHV